MRLGFSDVFSSFSHCWSQKLILYSVKIIIIIFSKTQLAMQLPAVKKRATAHFFVSFHIGLLGVAYVRSVGRSVGHNQTKISRTDGFTKIS